ncbi:MAG TPA: hypothetical protein VFZ65_11800 [Planctomycetota bacterium]|nr:hypothetical protein [Planctomycetota bacterium]
MCKCRHLVAVALGSLLVGCSSGSSGGGGAARQRSSLLSVTAVPGGRYALASEIQLSGGSLDLQTAVFEVDQVVIEENTGENGGSQGGENEGEGQQEREVRASNSESEGEQENEGGTAGEAEDLVFEGPFSIDIATGGAVLGSLPVYPGTFKKAEIALRLAGDAPLHSIRVEGTYSSMEAGTIPFTLRSHFLQPIQVPIANGGITVDAGAVMPIALTFDLAALFGGLEFATADVEGGRIVIDAEHNVHLLLAFETNLTTFVDCEHEEGR